MIYQADISQYTAKHAHKKSRLHRRHAASSALAAVVAVSLLALMISVRRNATAQLSQSFPFAEKIAYRLPEDAHTISDVPYISQRGEYETGCESVSAVMLLQYYGFDLTVDDFIDGYLPLGDAPYRDADGGWFGCDPWEAFPGDPRSSDGRGCYSTVIERAMNGYLADSAYRAEQLADIPLDDLCSTYIDRDEPVLIWATIDMKAPQESLTWTAETGREITWIAPMHCLVLIGYDADSYIFNDPWAGESVFYDKQSVETAYAAQYSQAVVLTH